MRNDKTDMSHFIYLTADEMKNFQIEIGDFIKECSFNEINCDMKIDFIKTYNQDYGYCYTFNSGLDEKAQKIL